MNSGLSLVETKKMFQQVAQRMIASQELLSEADRAIGDGDHGVGMARGFEAVLKVLESEDFQDLKGFFTQMGMALITSVGGASGIIFGTWFVGAGKRLEGKVEFNNDALMIFLKDGLKAVQERGKAKSGDKTMVDVLISACSALDGNENLSLRNVLKRVAQNAEEAAENTKSMVASVGRAKTLGKRSIGYVDPGALSASFILEFMYQFCLTLETRLSE